MKLVKGGRVMKKSVNALKIVAAGLAVGVSGFVAAPASAADYTSVMPRDIKWQDAPSIGKGAKTAVIDGDPKSSGPFVMRLKLPPKTTIGLHTHPTTENVTILSGTLYFAASDKMDPKNAKAYGPGSYFSIGQGKPMFAYSKDGEVIAQLHGTGPWGITYLESKDKPAKK
jgi:quercetin dioxygenase-like cupin family protein